MAPIYPGYKGAMTPALTAALLTLGLVAFAGYAGGAARDVYHLVSAPAAR
jgi:hypothetical protein